MDRDLLWEYRSRVRADIMGMWNKDRITFEHHLDKYMGFLEEEPEIPRLSLKKNNWGFSEAEGFVFLTLLCGIGGSRADVAIGRLGPTKFDEVSLSTIIPLTESDKTEAKNKHISYLSENSCLILKRTDLKKFEELQSVGLI